MGFDARGRGEKIAETGVFAAHKTPNNAQNHQGRRGIAHVFMHGFTFGSEKQIGKHTAHQQPMKQADEAIPHLDFLRHFPSLIVANRQACILACCTAKTFVLTHTIRTDLNKP